MGARRGRCGSSGQAAKARAVTRGSDWWLGGWWSERRRQRTVCGCVWCAVYGTPCIVLLHGGPGGCCGPPGPVYRTSGLAATLVRSSPVGLAALSTCVSARMDSNGACSGLDIQFWFGVGTNLVLWCSNTCVRQGTAPGDAVSAFERSQSASASQLLLARQGLVDHACHASSLL